MVLINLRNGSFSEVQIPADKMDVLVLTVTACWITAAEFDAKVMSFPSRINSSFWASGAEPETPGLVPALHIYLSLMRFQISTNGSLSGISDREVHPQTTSFGSRSPCSTLGCGQTVTADCLNNSWFLYLSPQLLLSQSYSDEAEYCASPKLPPCKCSLHPDTHLFWDLSWLSAEKHPHSLSMQQRAICSDICIDLVVFQLANLSCSSNVNIDIRVSLIGSFFNLKNITNLSWVSLRISNLLRSQIR